MLLACSSLRPPSSRSFARHVALLVLFALILTIATTATHALSDTGAQQQMVVSRAGIPGGPPCISLAESRYCSQWGGSHISGNLRNYFMSNPGHGVASVPIVNTTEAFDTQIMENIFLAEEYRKKYYSSLLGCDLDGQPVRYMTSYWCAVLIAYSPGCIDLTALDQPLCTETCSAYTSSMQSMINDPSYCTPSSVRSALAATGTNATDAASRNSTIASSGSGSLAVIPAESTAKLAGDATIALDPAWFCGLRMLSGRNMTVQCNTGAAEPFCGYLTLDAACANGCATEECPKTATTRTTRSRAAGTTTTASAELFPAGLSTTARTAAYVAIAGAAFLVSAGLIACVLHRQHAKARRQAAGSAAAEQGDAHPLPALPPSQLQLVRETSQRRLLVPPPESAAVAVIADPSRPNTSIEREPVRKFSGRRQRRPPPISIAPVAGSPAGPLVLPSLPTPTAPVPKTLPRDGEPVACPGAQWYPPAASFPPPPVGAEPVAFVPLLGDDLLDTTQIHDDAEGVPVWLQPDFGGTLPPPPAPATAAAPPSVAATMERGPSTRRARMAYVSDKSDELNIEVSDVLLVLEEYEDGWAHGYNWLTRVSGIFPLAVFDEGGAGGAVRVQSSCVADLGDGGDAQ
ncbi:hypothetical protein H9P43_002756 [Blastocladiella emersonii ATCC 22665]|nr:hypothetical protein H9P43_002756 [Blastocladiella emersonii ATCC 22665]